MQKGAEEVSDTIEVKREDLANWYEFVRDEGCDGCLHQNEGRCQDCYVNLIVIEMGKYLQSYTTGKGDGR